MPTDTASHRTYAWTRILDRGSVEHAAVARRGNALRIRGDILAVHDGEPLRVTYTLSTDEQGLSRHLTVHQAYGGKNERLVLEHAPGGWRINGRVASELAGCVDIDLGLSPSTNALPIGRMHDAGTVQADVQAAWVRFPSLEVVPATQRYTRTGAGAWRYESLTSGFRAHLQVDDWHLPVTYEGVWERAGVARGEAVERQRGFADALLSDTPSPAMAAHASDFDWLVGGWDATVQDFADDGTIKTSRGEWWFSWILEGRAMQDVWISPSRAERPWPADGSGGGRYGTTIRRYDEVQGVWRIAWINPVNGAENALTGSRKGDRIVLLGMDQGVPIKWQFVDIRPDRFTWQGYRLAPDGSTWRLQAQFDLRRQGVGDVAER